MLQLRLDHFSISNIYLYLGDEIDMNYAYNPNDAIISFINSDFSKESVYQLLREVGYTNISCILEPCTAYHAVLVDKTSSYSFTSVEIEWLHSVNLIMEYNVNDCYTVVIAEMNCNIDDYYIFCAATIKIFEKAFNHNSIYIFKISNAITFGCLRDSNKNIPNNYIISKLCNEENIYDFSDFLEELFVEDMDNIPFLISDYSPLKTHDDDDNYYKSYSDRIYDENDYINALLEIQSFYGVDTSKERERSSLILENDRKDVLALDCSELKSVAEEIDPKTSYEELLLATAASEKITASINDDMHFSLFDDDLPEVSDDAYKDAEKMLKELLDK